MKLRALKKKGNGFRSAGMGIALMALSFMTAGCMQSYGKFVSNPVILDRYQTGTLSNTYHYYFSGRSGLPDAVVGIDSNYRLKGRLWFKIETMNQVYEKIGNLSDLNADATALRTADILDHQGNLIGVWFSYFFYAPVNIDPETRTVEIQDPGIFSGGYGRSGP
jgi:hypothetical protein